VQYAFVKGNTVSPGQVGTCPGQKLVEVLDAISTIIVLELPEEAVAARVEDAPDMPMLMVMV
jgi:hypothetical protein